MVLIDVVKIPVLLSLGVVVLILALTMWLSVRSSSKTSSA
jgi:tellurite resistance protein TerC